MVPIEPAGPAGSNGTGFSFCTQKKVLERGFNCTWLLPRGHGCSRWRRRSAAEAQKIPVHAVCRRNGSLKHERRSFGTWGPGSWQNIPNFVCTQNFGYKTLVRARIWFHRAVTPTRLWLAGAGWSQSPGIRVRLGQLPP